MQIFYSDLRKVDGEMYKMQPLKCIQVEINRYTTESRNMDITSDVFFTKANEIFKARSHRCKKIGKAYTKLKKPIHQDDMSKITAFFKNSYINNPDTGQL